MALANIGQYIPLEVSIILFMCISINTHLQCLKVLRIFKILIALKLNLNQFGAI